MTNRNTTRMRKKLICFGLTFLFLVINRAKAIDDRFFESEIAPLLIKRCVECHNSGEASGMLDLTAIKGLRSGGESGESLTDPRPGENYLWQRVVEGEMPPEEKGQSRELSAKEKQLLRRWIQSGMEWPKDRVLDLYEFTNEVRGGRDWWSFQPIHRPSIPRRENSNDRTGFQNPIDAFVHAKHLEHALSFSKVAEPGRLFRRLHYDTTGLPPEFGDLEAFVKDQQPDAYEKWVDRLLASPRFGEHFARDWLDLVRYADTNGYERDAEKPNAWKYRDWVIQSINRDKPFDQFVKQQLAGDQLLPLSEENVVGTTMLRVGTWDDEPNDKLEYKYDRLEDLIHVTSTAFLGLTVKCARCHNHKFDPIPQEDYYRFGSIFWPGDLMGNASEKVKGFDVFAWSDASKNIETIRVLKKGNPRQPLKKVEPGFLSVLKELDTKFETRALEGKDTGRRLEFAERLVSDRNPLVARVIVNRIWQHYFGHGIVRTPNNFGYKGDLPTHPELLDWLASELIRQDWNLKPIHRLILTSRTYQQESGDGQESGDANESTTSVAMDSDPLNLFLSRMTRKRLGAEAIRDTMLRNSGQLNLHMGGRGFTPDVPEDALEGLSKGASAWNPSSPGQQARRGVYLFVKRSLIPPLMASFDYADTTRPCGQRDLTIVAPQALAMLNNRFVHAQSENLARLIREDESDLNRQIRMAFRKVFAREPAIEELHFAVAHYRDQLEHFRKRKQMPAAVKSKPVPGVPQQDLALHLDAEFNVRTDDEDFVLGWTDRTEQHIAQPKKQRDSPVLLRKKLDGRSVIAFNGSDQYLTFNKQVIKSDEFTIVVVGADRNRSGSREFFSNWNANGNSTSSVFLGLTDGRAVRFSDQFRSQQPAPSQPFVMTAISSKEEAKIFVGRRLLGKRTSGLSGRNLSAPYVIGTQGNFGHEFLDGFIAELLVYDRPLSLPERESLWSYLEAKYPSTEIKTGQKVKVPRSPEWLALASVCHALLNSNEALFID